MTSQPSISTCPPQPWRRLSLQPSIQLHIERLVLDGLPVNHAKGAIIGAAVEAELTRLLAERGLTHLSAGTVALLSATSIQVTRDTKPAQLGHEIAGALIESLPSNKLSKKHKGRNMFSGSYLSPLRNRP